VNKIFFAELKHLMQNREVEYDFAFSLKIFVFFFAKSLLEITE
jgi:hypothetical protein